MMGCARSIAEMTPTTTERLESRRSGRAGIAGTRRGIGDQEQAPGEMRPAVAEPKLENRIDRKSYSGCAAWSRVKGDDVGGGEDDEGVGVGGRVVVG